MVWPILGLLAGALLRGPTISTSTAEAAANIRQSTTVSTQQSCNNSQVIQVEPQTVNIGQILCDGDVNIGNLSAIAEATCDQYQDIAVIAKTLVDQAALSESESGIGLGLFTMAKANANTYVDVQNNVAVLLAASCTNAQQVNLGKRSFTAGVISGAQCNLLNSVFSQQAMCSQTILATIENTADVKQKVEAKATAGLDLGDLLTFFILLFGGFFILMLFFALLKSLLRSGTTGSTLAPSGLFGSGGASVAELTSKRNALRSVLQKRMDLITSNAAFPSILKR